MKLFLAVPNQTKGGISFAIPSAGRTRDWVERLPLLDTRESLMQIHGSLRGLNRKTIRIPQRLRLLDIHRSPLRVVRGQVESRFSKGAAPLSENDLTLAGLFRDCCVEMAYGYKIVVLEVARSRKRRQLDEMKLSMARALYYLEQTVFACALFRQSPPEGIWQEIHTLHSYARTLGLAEDPLKDPVAKVRTSTTISLTYRRALLFGLSDPFHQSVPLMTRIQDFLRRHAGNAQIKKHIRTPRGNCEFIIDPMSDYPARVFSQEEEQPEGALFLDTFELTHDARELMEKLESAEQVDVEIDSEFKDDLGRSLLKEVVYKWGLTATREKERSEVEQTAVEIMIGIDAANYCLNDEVPFRLFSVEGTEKNRREGNALELHPKQSDLKALEGTILDRGDSGLRITLSYDAADTETLRVRDVITCRGKEQTWLPAVIRWMRCFEDSIHFGVETISDTTRPVAVKRVSGEREGPFTAGLVIYHEGSDAPVFQLITWPGMYGSQRNLLVDNGRSLLMTRARELVERSDTMEWFECEILNL